MLGSALRPSSGSAIVAGFGLDNPDVVKFRIGCANQGASVYGKLSVEETLSSKPALTPFRQTLAGCFSCGWRQRLCIGIAIVHELKLIFLDEPTAGLDPVGRREWWDAIYTYVEGTTVFVTTHYMDKAECKTVLHSGFSKIFRVCQHVLESEKREHVIDFFEVSIPQKVMISPMVN